MNLVTGFQQIFMASQNHFLSPSQPKATVFVTLFVAFNIISATFVASHETMHENYNNVNLLTKYLEDSMSRVQKAKKMTDAVKQYHVEDTSEQKGLQICLKFIDRSIDRIQGSIAALRKYDIHSYHDAHTWLSSVLTHHVACLDSLQGSARILMERYLDHLITRDKTSLDMFVALDKPAIDEPENEDFPLWMTREDRKHLKYSSIHGVKPDVVVAQDGTGNYRTLKEAVQAAPDNRKSRYIIYVKAGTYRENVVVGKTKTNLMIMGDNKDSTLITGSLNAVDGQNIQQSPTLGVDADGFIVSHICIQNTAGAEKMQAVALRIAGDKAIVSQCKIDGYQDTLFADTNRQFYSESTIMGTIDFIFGNAQTVIQNCTILCRRPLNGQANMITAQGRYHPNQNTAISIQFCSIMADESLVPVKNTIRTYLGRPWKIYSRTMVMQSFIDDLVDPTGWSVWQDKGDVTDLYYAEFENYGRGADTSHRVNWPGYHKVTREDEAIPFTVGRLLDGDTWLRHNVVRGVHYTLGLHW